MPEVDVIGELINDNEQRLLVMSRYKCLEMHTLNIGVCISIHDFEQGKIRMQEV